MLRPPEPPVPDVPTWSTTLSGAACAASGAQSPVQKQLCAAVQGAVDCALALNLWRLADVNSRQPAATLSLWELPTVK